MYRKCNDFGKYLRLFYNFKGVTHFKRYIENCPDIKHKKEYFNFMKKEYENYRKKVS